MFSDKSCGRPRRGGTPRQRTTGRTANGPEVDLVIEQVGGAILAVECKWKECPDIADAAGLRALEAAEKGRIKDKFILCRTKAAYKLSDGTW